RMMKLLCHRASAGASRTPSSGRSERVISLREKTKLLCFLRLTGMGTYLREFILRQRRHCGGGPLMIHNDEQLNLAQEDARNLQRVLVEARKIHTPAEYRAMSAPILLELQQREQEILIYLSRTEGELTVD